MRHFSTISSLLLLGTTVSLLMKKWSFNHNLTAANPEEDYHLYL
ncbi:hypothetical protein [uncultured Pontibacter sp.]|nr:hypothetical protein [uncultured Pontibacter sp.]